MAVSSAKAAAATHEGTSAIINRVVANMNPSTIANMPTKNALRQRIQRQRLKHYPPIPRVLDDLVLPPEWQLTKAGDNWILQDAQGEEPRMMIFCSPQSLDILRRSSSWYGDGTFKVAPPMFYQLYTIHAEHFGAIVPAAFCLMPGKSKEIYVKMFNIIKVECGQ